MAITCPGCGHQFDVTLFEFGNTVECNCGTKIRLDPEKGVITQNENRKGDKSRL